MFWRFGFHTASAIDSILAQEEFTLEDLLEESDILQETKANNNKLIEYLSKDEVLTLLIDYIVKDPLPSVPEKLKYKYPNICGEILSAEVYLIFNRLSSNRDHLEHLWSYFLKEPPLNPLLTSFCSKVFVMLLTKKPGETVSFLQEKDDCIEVLLKQLNTSAAADFLLKFLTSHDSDHCVGLLDWFRQERVVKRLVERFSRSYGEDIEDSASQLLIDLIILDKSQEIYTQDSLSSDIRRKENLEALLNHMFDGETHTLMSGILVFIALLTPYSSQHVDSFSLEDMEKDQRMTFHLVMDAMIPYVGKLKKHLVEPIQSERMVLSSGELDPPLGTVRLRIIELFAFVTKVNYLPMCEEMDSEGIPKVCLDLMLKYEFNNFLHCEVVDIFRTVLTQTSPCDADGKKTENSSNHPLFVNIFKDCRLLEIICSSSKDNKHSSGDLARKGYMGHLYSIANTVVDALEADVHKDCEYFNSIAECVTDEWAVFKEVTLVEVNDLYHRELGGHKPLKDSNDMDDVYEDETKLEDLTRSVADQLSFNRYLCQQVSANFEFYQYFLYLLTIQFFFFRLDLKRVA